MLFQVMIPELEHIISKVFTYSIKSLRWHNIIDQSSSILYLGCFYQSPFESTLLRKSESESIAAHGISVLFVNVSNVTS